MKRWTTEEQQRWIEDRASDFVLAQQDNNVGPYMSLCTHEWFEIFTNTMPLDSDISPKELEAANRDLEKAKVEKKKKVSRRFKCE